MASKPRVVDLTEDGKPVEAPRTFKERHAKDVPDWLQVGEKLNGLVRRLGKRECLAHEMPNGASFFDYLSAGVSGLLTAKKEDEEL